MSAPLRNAADLAGRLDLGHADRLLLVDAPEPLRALAVAARTGLPEPDAVEAEAIRAVKGTYDAILVWREERPGSEALLTRAAKRLAEGGALWVVVAQRKVTGPRTPAVHRLSREDVTKIFEKLSLAPDREVRVTAWHVAHRFVKRPAYST